MSGVSYEAPLTTKKPLFAVRGVSRSTTDDTLVLGPLNEFVSKPGLAIMAMRNQGVTKKKKADKPSFPMICLLWLPETAKC